MKLSSQNDLNKYLPETKQLQESKKYSLYANFSTIQQIAQSLEMQKNNFEHEMDLFQQRISATNNKLIKAKDLNKELFQKILDFNSGIEKAYCSDGFDFDQDYPKIPFKEIFYDLKETHTCEITTRKDELNYFLTQIQKAEKQCAKIYCAQNEKFQFFSQNLKEQFKKLKKIKRNETLSKESQKLEAKIFLHEQQLKIKIKNWQKTLNNKFSSKILNLIEKIQSSM